MSASGSQPTGTVTFLFTDIEGSTRRWEADPVAMRAAVAEHESVLSTAISSRGGHVVKTMGDGVMAVFSDPVAAVEAAVDALGRITDLKLRVGLHTGTAQERDGDFYGPTVNRAARIMAIAHGGQIILSETTSSLVRDAVALTDLGEHALRDLNRPEHIWQVGDVSFPALRSAGVAPSNLPTELTSFIGREHDVAVVAKLVNDHRLVTITGAAGCGKTRLALRSAHQLLDVFPDGCWFVDLAPLADPDLVDQTVADVLGVTETSGRTITERIVEWLGARRALIVLDNCEHVLATTRRLANDLLRSTERCHVLATSREPLGIAAEHIMVAPSLELPDGVELFVDRATAQDSRFSPTADDRNAIEEIVHRLDGIPLAIELAAARTSVLDCRQIAQRLNDRFRLLTGGSRTALERHQTLRAALDWSYQALDDRERELLNTLSVFAGGCTLDALEYVLGFDCLDEIASLVKKSLVNRTRNRYRLLESVRQYGREQLVASGHAEAIAARHADYFADVVSRCWIGVRSAEYAEAYATVDADYDNIRQALDWIIESGDAERAQKMVGELQLQWSGRTYWTEGLAWCDRALSLDGASELSHAWALRARALVAYLLRDPGFRESDALTAIEVFERLNDREGLEMAQYWILADMQVVAGNPEQALAYGVKGSQPAGTIGPTSGGAMSAAIAARAATALGRFDLAREYATNAAAQADAAGNPSFAAMVRINGAATYLVVGDRDAALSDAYNSLRQVQVAGISGTVRGWFVDYALFVLSSLGVRDATTVLSQRDAEPPGSHAWMRHLSDAALALAENDYSRAFASSGLAVEECVRYRNLPDLYWAVAITVRSFVGAGRLREAVQLSGSLERELAEHGFDTRYLLESYEDAVNDCRAALDPRTFEELRSAGAAAPVIKLHKQLCDEASH